MVQYSPTVAVYGGANMDIQARSRGAFLPGDSNPGYSSLSMGGVGRNIAENAARLGLRTELVTVFGGDEMAAHLADGCRRLGVEVGRSLILPNEETSRYICLLDADGSLVGAVSAMDALDRFGPDELATRYGPGDEAEVVVIDANLPPDTIAAAAYRWRGKPLLLDPVSASKAVSAIPSLGRFSMVKPNLAEARVLLGLPELAPGDFPSASASAPDGDSDRLAAAKEAALALLGLGLREAYVSLGSMGLLWAFEGGMGLARPLSLPVINVSGAGDAATAAIAWATVKRLAPPEKAARAIAAASLCATSIDTVAAAMTADRLAALAKGVRNEQLP